MSITFAGVDITPPSDADREAGLYWHGHRVEEFEYQGYLAQGVQHLPTPFFPKREEPRIGVLSWPTGADRWSLCHLVCTGTQAASIRAVIGVTPAAHPLVFSDGTNPVTADMFLQSLRPISQRGDGFEFYLLTLVDDRYFWWTTGNASAPSAPASWSALFTSLFTSLGVTPTIATIPAAYGTPNPTRWNVGIQPLPVVIEAACKTVGLRCVRALDGTVSLVNYTTAAAADVTRWTALQTKVLAGGQVLGADIARALPEQVDTCFGDGSSTSTTLASLALPLAGGVTGVDGARATIKADPDASSPSYAAQAAQDYYNWAFARTDATLRLFTATGPVGLDDSIEYAHTPDAMVSRILRPPWTDRNLYGEPGPSPAPEGTAPEFKDECVNGFLARYTATLTLDADGLFQTAYVFDRSLGIPCTESQIANSSRTETPYISVEVVTNICLDSSGGLVVEKRRILIPSNGAISKPGCAATSTRCCPSGSGAETDCCPDGSTPATAVAVAIDGPLAAACGLSTVAAAAYRIGDVGLEYEVFLTTDFGESLFTIYCDGTQWKAIGSLASSVGVIFFNIELETLPITGILAGTIMIPGCGEVVVLVSSPCSSDTGSEESGSTDSGSSSTGSGETVLSACCGIDDRIPVNLCMSFTGPLSTLGLVALTYDPAGTFGPGWYGSVSGCGGTVFFEYYCTETGGFALNALSTGGAAVFFLTGTSGTCTPFIQTSSYVDSNTGGCGGGGDGGILISECLVT